MGFFHYFCGWPFLTHNLSDYKQREPFAQWKEFVFADNVAAAPPASDKGLLHMAANHNKEDAQGVLGSGTSLPLVLERRKNVLYSPHLLTRGVSTRPPEVSRINIE